LWILISRRLFDFLPGELALLRASSLPGSLGYTLLSTHVLIAVGRVLVSIAPALLLSYAAFALALILLTGLTALPALVLLPALAALLAALLALLSFLSALVLLPTRALLPTVALLIVLRHISLRIICRHFKLLR
jgi:hypothetical protein